MLPGKKIELSDILQMLRRRIWLIAIPPVVTLFAALMYSSTVTNMYQSDMLIAIDPQRVPDAFVRSTVTLSTDQRLDAITVRILSRTALQQVIEEFKLYEDELRTTPMDEVVSKMRSKIEVALERPRPQWGMPSGPTAFHLRFTYSDPAAATAVTDRLGTTFVAQNTTDRGALAGATNRFLEGQLDAARKTLEEQERKLEAFRQLHGQALPTQLQSNMQAVLNTQMQVQSLVESMARDRDRKQMLERLYRDDLALANATPAVVARASGTTAPSLQSAQQQLAEAKAALAALELRYQADHPDVARARRMVATQQQKAEAEAASLRARIEAPSPTAPVAVPPEQGERLRQSLAEIESLDRQIAFKESEERRLRSTVEQYQRHIEAVPGLESAWTSLTRDYDTQQAAYKELLSKSTAAKVSADLEHEEIGERFRIVDPARVPVHPLASLRVRYNAGGFALGLLFGAGLAFLLEWRDATFRSDADVLDVLGLPVLASIPRVETAAESALKRRRRLVASSVGAACVAMAGYLTWTLKLWTSLL